MQSSAVATKDSFFSCRPRALTRPARDTAAIRLRLCEIKNPFQTILEAQGPQEVMSEGETPALFKRGSRTRASLPVVKSSNHTKEKSLGVLYLQYGDETKQILMPNEVSSTDTVRALFVSAFPQQLTLKMLDSPNVVIYIKDQLRNVYYELTDVRNITSHSCLKVYHKDPTQVFNHTSRNNNGDSRVSRERLYGTRQPTAGQSMVHSVPAPQSPIYTVQGSLSPPLARSVPASPSRFAYSSQILPAGATLPRERTSNTSCSSSILERRDVKPDEDISSYILPETRLSISDIPDGAVFFPHTLYRQKSRKYSESPLSPKNQKTPPPSPHRVNEVRMIDIVPGQNTHAMGERASPVRRSLRKDSNSTMESASRTRGNTTAQMFADFPNERGLHGVQSMDNPQSERMKAMEQQIASLTGLLQNALLRSTNTSVVIEPASEKTFSTSPAYSTNSGGISPVAVSNSPLIQSQPPVSPAVRDPALGLLLCSFRKNVSTLRYQLHQLRQTQLQNQDAIRLMLHQAEEELTQKMCKKLQLQDDPVQKQKVHVNEERCRYEAMEESVLIQLGELEQHVEQLKRDSNAVPSRRPVTLRDVEEGAINLRKVGEALAALKGEFPALQSKMHSVLKVEVETVRFLKEEPQKMDTMLKRVKTLTDTLSGLRIRVMGGCIPSDPVSVKPEEPNSKRIPQLRSSFKNTHSESTPSLISFGTVCSSSRGSDSPTVATESPTSLELERHSIIEEELLHSNTISVKPIEIKQTEDELNMDQRLKQAQANLMKNIPDLEVSSQDDTKTSNVICVLSDVVDGLQTSLLTPEATAPPEPVAEKQVQTSMSHIHNAPIELPNRASVEQTEPNQDTANKSPPPPPPRRLHPPGTGMTTSRSGEVVYAIRKEPVPNQQEQAVEIVQAKPQKVRPEIKPKPHVYPSIRVREREEEEDEERKIIAELQNKAQQNEDENHSAETPPGSGVIYYITGTSQLPTDNPPGGTEVHKEPKEGTISPVKVVPQILNHTAISQQPHVPVPSNVTLDSPKPVEESQKESTDCRKMYVSPSEPPKDDNREYIIPKLDSSQSNKETPENLMLLSTSEKFITATQKSSSYEPKAKLMLSQIQSKASVLLNENGNQTDEQQLVMSSRSQTRSPEDGGLSPDLPEEELPPPPDNIAFMITKNKVQALSTGEYQQLVSSKNEDIETVKVGTDETVSAPEDGEFSKKPVIIVFDEPMDIRQAYKRLSTIFECEEELDRSLSRECIIEDNEETNEEAESQITDQVMMKTGLAERSTRPSNGNYLQVPGQSPNLECTSRESEDAVRVELPNDFKQEAKKKFKFKFPKKQLAAIGQALRTGTKTGKKTLQVVVYEDEEEPDGTLKEAREAKRFEIKTSTDANSLVPSAIETSETSNVSPQPSIERTNEICQTTYKTLDSLEETIKQLETTISNMDPALSPKASHKEFKVKRASEDLTIIQAEGSPSKKPAPPGPKPQKPPQRKKPKVQCVPRPSSSGSLCSGNAKQSSNGSSSSSRISSPRFRQQAGSPEKPVKSQKLQDSQSQFRQVVLL